MNKEIEIRESKTRHVDPRPKYMTKKTESEILGKLFDYTLYYDPVLTPEGEFNGMLGNVTSYAEFTTFMADFQTAGGNIPNTKHFENYDYSLMGAVQRYGFNKKDMTTPQSFHFELIRESANAIRLGAVVDLDNRTREILSNSTQKYVEDNGMRVLVGERRFSHHWDKVVPYAKILDLDFSIPAEWKEKAEYYLTPGQEYEIENKVEKGYGDDSLYFAMRFGDLAANLAQARILGIKVPVLDRFLPKVHKNVALAKKDSRFSFPSALTNLSIITATDVNVGLPRGLELKF